jgi:lipid A 3-O-deacylase
MTLLTAVPDYYQYCRLAMLVASALAPALIQAQQEAPRYLSVIAENDIYAPRGQDRHYTNGVRIGVGLQDQEDTSWYTWLGKTVLPGTDTQTRRYELAFGQNIYTPQFYIASFPIPQDRPYAGWLYGELSASSHRPGTTSDISVNLGIVGPAALGEPAQKLIHDVVGDPEPAGWDNQLRNEPAVLVRYRRNWFLPLFETGPVRTDIVGRLGFNLGNVFTDAGIGTAFRIGNYLPEQDLPLRIQPGLSGGNSYMPVRRRQFDWMMFADIQGRIVAQNIFLDGNTFNDSMSVDKRTFVRDLAAGIVLGFGQFNVPLFASFTVVWRGREFDIQQGGNSFGSAMIGISY